VLSGNTTYDTTKIVSVHSLRPAQPRFIHDSNQRVFARGTCTYAWFLFPARPPTCIYIYIYIHTTNSQTAEKYPATGLTNIMHGAPSGPPTHHGQPLSSAKFAWKTHGTWSHRVTSKGNSHDRTRKPLMPKRNSKMQRGKNTATHIKRHEPSRKPTTQECRDGARNAIMPKSREARTRRHQPLRKRAARQGGQRHALAKLGLLG
jgi:hypothetical protein